MHASNRHVRLTPAAFQTLVEEAAAARETEFLSRLVAVAGQAGPLRRAESA